MAYLFRAPCEIDGCDADVARLADMQRHVKEHHKSPLVCPAASCSWRGVKRKGRLESHLLKAHADIHMGVELIVPNDFGTNSPEPSPFLLAQVAQPQSPVAGAIITSKDKDFYEAESEYSNHGDSSEPTQSLISSPVSRSVSARGDRVVLTGRVSRSAAESIPSSSNLGKIADLFSEQDIKLPPVSDKLPSFGAAPRDSAYPAEECLRTQRGPLPILESMRMLRSCFRTPEGAIPTHWDSGSHERTQAARDSSPQERQPRGQEDVDFDAPRTHMTERMIQGDGGDGFSLPSLVNNMAVYSELFNGSEEEFIGKVFEENADLTSRFPATLTDSQGQGSNNSNQSNPTPPRSLPQPKDGSQGTGTSNKRKRGEDDEGESNHPNKPRKYGRHVGCEPYEQEHQRGRSSVSKNNQS
ncbi:uncharacterized protein K444DRAFT_606517 [Hyaloscypha bicolor E]|uniref:Uncharacterized protein n=1 Tax=Hyaloscypha bicolor E TaxID=1095630 RepID=A0A2J6TX61_9HELO|nr:uncharacterized protein K444DRAFT_606517 [Hyaloscypha bicolor E]PMD67603.1 hypothetical protein K444DRAFT_606517 [Hyaloscypha bicolor E]